MQYGELSLYFWISGALCYTELGTIFPDSGGEYSYFLNTFAPVNVDTRNKKIARGKSRDYGRTVEGFFRPLPAFLFCWVSIFIQYPSSLAIICLIFAQYLQRVFGIGCESFVSIESAEKLIAACAIRK